MRPINETIVNILVARFEEIEKERDRLKEERLFEEAIQYFNQAKQKLFIEYIDYEEELNVFFNKIQACFCNRIGRSINKECGKGCIRCALEGYMYDCISYYINTPYESVG